MTLLREAFDAWCLFWGVLDAAILIVLLAVAAWSSVPRRKSPQVWP